MVFAEVFGTSSSPEDLDGNGIVDFADFLVFAAAFGTSGDGSSGGDAGGDDIVVSAISGQATDTDVMAVAFAPYSWVSTRSDDNNLYVDS